MIAAGSKRGVAGGVLPQPQAVLNGEIHGWYRIIHGYSDHLVSGLLDEFGMTAGDCVLDPFCGTGTTLVECMKRGIDSVGIDANPASQFAARVKTRWGLDPERLLQLCSQLRPHYHSVARRKRAYLKDPTYVYMQESGLIERGWISLEPARKAIAVKAAIQRLDAPWTYKHAFTLALMSELISAANIKFGPELYCSGSKTDADVLNGVADRIAMMASDLVTTSTIRRGAAVVLLGDARRCSAVVRRTRSAKFSSVICSPPYPNERDYTRNARLELALLEAVTNTATLRTIKRTMIRSHTKGIYSGDDDGSVVSRMPSVKRIAASLDRKAAKYDHGFARLYSTVIREYFGGMRKHLVSVRRLLRKDAMCAYVVGDQASYLGEFVATARVLGQIAERVGFSVVEIRKWRGRRSSTGAHSIDENVLILKNRMG